MVKMTVTATATIRRGPESWNYIYIFFGFVLSIGSTVISMVPDVFPWNIVAFVMFTAVCIYFFLFNGWFQNKLLSLKFKYENVSR